MVDLFSFNRTTLHFSTCLIWKHARQEIFKSNFVKDYCTVHFATQKITQKHKPTQKEQIIISVKMVLKAENLSQNFSGW